MSRRALGRVLIAGLVLAGGAGAATGAGPGHAVRARLIFSSGMCGDTGRRPAVTWIGGASALDAVYGRIGRHEAADGARPPASVDFARRAVLWVAMGMQPSAGYGLSLPDSPARIVSGTLTLRVNWLGPAPGRVFAQVVTHPCLLVTVPRAGYHRIEVRDQHGRPRLRTEVTR